MSRGRMRSCEPRWGLVISFALWNFRYHLLLSNTGFLNGSKQWSRTGALDRGQLKELRRGGRRKARVRREQNGPVDRTSSSAVSSAALSYTLPC